MSMKHSRLRRVLGAVALVCAGCSQASVVMTGTRVVYPASQTEQTLQFHNPDTHPNVVQVWLDAGDPASSPDANDTPFLALPQVFRMEPHAGQMVRLMLTDADSLPQDRESVFYLNFSQMPGHQKTASPNQLMFMFTSRVKVFYRPVGLDPDLPADFAQQLQVTRRGAALHVDNPTPYHAVVKRVEVAQGGAPLPVVKGVMIAPFSSAVWNLPEAVANHGLSVRLVLLNDYGADVVSERQIP